MFIGKYVQVVWILLSTNVTKKWIHTNPGCISFTPVAPCVTGCTQLVISTNFMYELTTNLSAWSFFNLIETNTCSSQIKALSDPDFSHESKPNPVLDVLTAQPMFPFLMTGSVLHIGFHTLVHLQIFHSSQLIPFTTALSISCSWSFSFF